MTDQLELIPKVRHWTVSELTAKVKNVVEPSFSDVWVVGEVSNLRPAASGHLYFSIKDSGATLSVAVFGWGARKPKFEMKDGLQVVCHGKVSLYPPRGSYQLLADKLEPLGAGAIQLSFERLKAKLQAEGLFEVQRKKRLPLFPKKIVVITSPTGAAIQDMLNILRRRCPFLSVLIVPAVVQGDEAPRHLIKGLEVANRLKLGDVIVLARGGGSIEDLNCFNDEALARTIAASEIPVVSAVGHEIDFTISDFVADLRAPTPSAAAEMITGSWVDTVNKIQDLNRRLPIALQRQIATKKSIFLHLSARLVSPRDRLRVQIQKLDELTLRFERAIAQTIEKSKSHLQQVAMQLDALSPLKVLDRGYALIQNEEGKVIRSARLVKKNKKFTLRFSDGTAVVEGV